MKNLLAKSALLIGAILILLPYCAAQISPPTFWPAAGTYSRPFTLQITANSAAIIYYTTDGSTPTTSSSVYSGPIAIGPGTTTVQALDVITDSGTSAVTTGAYTVAPETSTTQL